MYAFDKPKPIMLSVLPICSYTKFISIILNLFPSHLLLYLFLNISASAHSYVPYRGKIWQGKVQQIW